MAQILRIDCPLFKRGLAWPQRLNYFNATLHFFFGAPRLIMILAPLSFLLFGIHPIKADVLAVIAYILPHVGISMIANSIISKTYRHSFWAGVYEVSIAPYTAMATLLAIVNPRKGKFVVTDKGANVDVATFDFATTAPTLALLGLSFIGLAIAFPLRLALYDQNVSDPTELDSILINSIWAVANLVTLIAAACVGYEQPQQRRTPRVRRAYPVKMSWDGNTFYCRSLDLSEHGVRLQIGRPIRLPHECRISIRSDFGVTAEAAGVFVRSEVKADGQMEAALKFLDVEPETHRRFVQLMFSGDQSWTAQQYPGDELFRSFWRLITTFWRATKPLTRTSPQSATPGLDPRKV
jgi:cellulose synthase (UDP-forming)